MAAVTVMSISTPELVTAPHEQLHIPRLRTKAHLSTKITVFFAAAGFGKTYAMAEACEALRAEGASVVWFSSSALAVPSGDVFQGIHHFAERLADAEVVFIDDLDRLTPEQRKALLQAFVLTARQRKIVLGTRSLDDLGVARLLADGAAQLIQADTLRWRHRQLSDLWQNRLTARQIDFIDGIAQGWPAVSQLLARFISKSGNTATEALCLNESLAGDYIRSEVLSTFTSSDIYLLSMTSVVETFDDALIEQLSDNTTLRCDELARRLPGLCNYESGGTRVSYNRALRLYLRQVFASLPKNRRCRTLRQAADWASTRGDVVSAVNLAAEAGDRQRVVTFVTMAGGLLIQAARGHVDLRAIVATAGEALVATEPRLKLMKCIVLLKDGQFNEALRLFREAASASPLDADNERAVECVRLFLLTYGCELATISEAEVMLSARRLDQDPGYTDIAPTILAIMHYQRADFDDATMAISAARACARDFGATYNLMFLDLHSTIVGLARGDLDGARTYLTKARLRWRSEFSTDHAPETVILALGAQLAFERGNVAQARQLAGQLGNRLACSEAWLDIYFAGYEPAMRLLSREQGLGAALAAVERSALQMQQSGRDRIAAGLRDIGACLIGEEILKGRAGLGLSVGDDAPKGELESWQEHELRVLAFAYRCLANDKLRDARRGLDDLIIYSELHGLARTKLRALLLRQVAQDRLGDRVAATADFDEALRIGAQFGMRQAFLEFGADAVKARLAVGAPAEVSDFAEGLRDLLAAADPSPSANTLTKREAEVLELLTSGASDKAIARQLEVTEHAVRFHLKNIYRKLGVHDRSSAISHQRAA